MSRALVSRRSTVGLAIPSCRAICFEVCRSIRRSRQARCLSVRRAQRSASSNVCDLESLMFTLLSKLPPAQAPGRSEEHTSELQSLMRISYAVFCLKKKKEKKPKHTQETTP